MLVASETKNPRNTAAGLLVPQTEMPGTSALAPTDHFIASIPTAWGICGATWKYHEHECDAGPFCARPSSARLCRIIPPGLPAGELRRQLMRNLGPCNEVIGDRFGNFHPEVVPDWFPELVRFLQGYYTNGLRDWSQPAFDSSWAFWSVRLDWSRLTEFQCAVLKLTAQIGRGKTLTYGEVAKKIGKPRASRAVGAALGANPWPVLVPCHRVVGKTGRLTGFSAPGGVSAKARMLALEESDALFHV